MKIIKVENCKECPYLKSDRHYYCSKKYSDNPSAYHAGFYAENSRELEWMFENCPLEDIGKPYELF